MFKSQPRADAAVEETSRPTLRTIYPLWGLLNDRFQTLCAREEVIVCRLNQISAEQDRRNAVFMQEPAVNITRPPKPKTPIRAGVLALLGKLAPEPESEPTTKPETVFEYTRPGDQEAVALGKEYEDIRAAKDIILPRLAMAHEEGSRLLCEALAGAYQPVADRVCQAMVELGSALLSHKAFTQDLVEQGAAWHHLRPAGVITLEQLLGDPRNRDSHWRRILSGAAEGGYWDPRSLPADWQPAATT